MLAKFVWKQKQTLRTEKENKDRTKKTIMFSKKGLMDRKEREKMEFWKGRQKEKKQKKKNRKTKRVLKRGLLGDQKRKNSKTAENSPLGGLKKTKENKNTREQQDTFVHVDTQPPIFGKFLFFTYTKAAFCWKHDKNSVLSRAQLLCITDGISRPLPKTPLWKQKGAIWGSPLCLLKPYFVAFGSFLWSEKRETFKTDSVNRSPVFAFRT